MCTESGQHPRVCRFGAFQTSKPGMQLNVSPRRCARDQWPASTMRMPGHGPRVIRISLRNYSNRGSNLALGRLRMPKAIAREGDHTGGKMKKLSLALLALATA